MERLFVPSRFGKISILHRKGSIPLIALHGIGSSGESFAKLEKYLDKKFDLYFLDLLGHGESEKPEIEYTIDVQCKMLDDVIKNLNLENFSLMGNSFGGWVSLRYSIGFKKPKVLILIDSAGLQPPVGTMPKEYIDNFVKFLMKNKRNDERVLRNMILHNQEMHWRLKPEELENIDFKTIIIWGKGDNVIDPQYAFLFNKYIKNSELFLLDAGHMPQFEKPEELAKIINEKIMYFI